MQFVFTQEAESDFLKLDKGIQILIRKKLQKIKDGEWYHLKPLTNMLLATHRLRIEDYRLLLRECKEWYEILAIWHRSTIYT